MSNTVFLKEGVTQGRGVPVLVSHNMVGPSGISILSRRSEECCGWGGGGHFCCSSARAWRSRPHTVRALQFLERASATSFFFPDTWCHLQSNSVMADRWRCCLLEMGV